MKYAFDTSIIKRFDLLFLPIHFGFIVSTLSLFFFLSILLLSKKFHNLPGRNLTSLCISWIGVNMIYLWANNKLNECVSYEEDVMKLIVYFYTSGSAWNLIISYDTWRSMRRSSNKCAISKGNRWRRYCMYSIFGWIYPLCLAIQHQLPSTKEELIFIPMDLEDLLWFILDYRMCPWFFLLTGNLFFGIGSLYYITKNSFSMQMQQSRTKKFIMFFTLPMKVLMINGGLMLTPIIFLKIHWDLLFVLSIVLYSYQGFFMTILFTYGKNIFQTIKIGRSRCLGTY